MEILRTLIFPPIFYNCIIKVKGKKPRIRQTLIHSLTQTCLNFVTLATKLLDNNCSTPAKHHRKKYNHITISKSPVGSLDGQPCPATVRNCSPTAPGWSYQSKGLSSIPSHTKSQPPSLYKSSVHMGINQAGYWIIGNGILIKDGHLTTACGSWDTHSQGGGHVSETISAKP